MTILPALIGAAGLGLAGWGLALWAPSLAAALSPRLRIKQRLAPLTAPPRQAARYVFSYFNRLVDAAGNPFGWTGAMWMRYGLASGILFGAMFWWLTDFELSTLAAAVALTAAGPAGLLWALRQEALAIKRRRQLEIVRLIDGIQVLLSGGSQNLFSAISLSVPMLDVLREPVERMLARWGRDPVRALDFFRQEAPMEETATLSAVLQHAMHVGELEAAPFLAQEGDRLEKIRDEQIREIIQARPQMLSLALIFPLAAVALVFLYPFFHRILALIGRL